MQASVFVDGIRTCKRCGSTHFKQFSGSGVKCEPCRQNKKNAKRREKRRVIDVQTNTNLCEVCQSTDFYKSTGRCKQCSKAANAARAAGRWSSPAYREQQARWRKQNPAAYLAKKARYRARLLNAYPLWLTNTQEDLIDAVYFEATELTLNTGIPHHVDHIVPLQGENVCGLHVPWNLRAIPAKENIRKQNSFNGWGPEGIQGAA